MIIQRDRYLQKLIRRRENGMVKVITGIRRCGKSYLLFELYRQYLNADGVADDHIIELALDEDQNARYRNPVELGQYIRSLLADKSKTYYVFLDDKAVKGSLSRALQINSESDKNHVTNSERKIISETLERSFMASHIGYKEPTRQLELQFK